MDSATLLRVLRKLLPGPSHCRNCDGLSFSAAHNKYWHKKWICTECEYVHAMKVGGEWTHIEPCSESRLT